MSEDPRDLPRVETDKNGDKFYLTEDGRRFSIASDDEAKLIQKVEKHLQFLRRFPTGMK